MPKRYRKTAKGQAEIETRAHRLSPRLRALLIMVDGKRDLAALSALVPQQAEEALNELMGQGFIEAFGDAPPAAPTAAPSAATASTPSAPSAPLDFEKLRREAVRALTDVAGPAAETVALRMEKARNLDELRPLITQAAQTVASMRGRAAAEAYAARFL